jgi:hypothetical protein
MTAPWLRRPSKTDDWEGIAALLAVGLHFVLAAAFATAVFYADYWLVDCAVDACDAPGTRVAIYGFLVFDILLFLGAWGWSVVLSSRGWWRIAPPLGGALITVITGAIALYWVYLTTR